MVDPVETANEQIAEAHHEHGENDPWPRRMAIAVSFLAAALAFAEVGAKSSQTAYLTHHIGVSDTWNFYQAKNLRANLWETQIVLLESLPAAGDPAVREKIQNARTKAAHERDDPGAGDGMKQLKQSAGRQEEEREVAFHAYHGYEFTAGMLEISIVLASVSVVTKIRTLGLAASAMGLLACAYGLAVYGHLT